MRESLRLTGQPRALCPYVCQSCRTEDVAEAAAHIHHARSAGQARRTFAVNHVGRQGSSRREGSHRYQVAVTAVTWPPHQIPVRIQQSGSSQSYGFANGSRRYSSTPANLADEIPRLSFRHVLQDLPHHDTCALESQLPMANAWFGNNVFAQLDPWRRRAGFMRVLHVGSLQASKRGGQS